MKCHNLILNNIPYLDTTSIWNIKFYLDILTFFTNVHNLARFLRSIRSPPLTLGGRGDGGNRRHSRRNLALWNPIFPYWGLRVIIERKSCHPGHGIMLEERRLLIFIKRVGRRFIFIRYYPALLFCRLVVLNEINCAVIIIINTHIICDALE